MTLFTEPPALDIELWHSGAAPLPLREHHALECRIVWQLLQHLQASGFELLGIFDGEVTRRCDTHKGAMELLFTLDSAWLRVRKDGGRRGHNIPLVPGRGEGIIGDHWVAPGDPDRFAACMAGFHALRRLALQ
jgi:hypothetical protein